MCVATHLSLPKDPPSAARGAKRALLTAKARGGKRQQLQQRQAALPEAAEAAVPTDPHRRPTAAAGASTAAGARRRPEPQATKAPSAAPTSSRSLVLAPTSAAVPAAAHARQPLTLAPEKHGRAPGDRNGKEICLGSRVLDGQGRRGEIVKRCGAWLTMRSDAGGELAVRRRSVEVIDAEEAEPPSRALVARREVAPPAAPSAPLRVAAAPAAAPPAAPPAAQPAMTARDRWRQAIAPPIPPADVFVGVFFDSASGGWCFHAAGRTTHGFPSALAALAACEAQESPQLTVPATHSSMRIAS